jgi:hypothetical protein
VETSQMVLEEVMRAAIAAARRAAAQAASGDRHAAGQVFAYHDVLSVLKEQADLAGVQFDDEVVAGFDPDELIRDSAPLRQAA